MDTNITKNDRSINYELPGRRSYLENILGKKKKI